MTKERVIPDPLGPLTEHVIALANAFYERTGRHGITRISLTPDVGLSFGIVPGTSVDVQTSAGRVEVYAVGALGDLRAQIDRDRADAFRIPVVIDPTMPPGTFEMRSGAQRIRATVEPEEQCGQCGAVVVGHHACPGVPGDEDRSER